MTRTPAKEPERNKTKKKTRIKRRSRRRERKRINEDKGINEALNEMNARNTPTNHPGPLASFGHERPEPLDSFSTNEYAMGQRSF